MKAAKFLWTLSFCLPPSFWSRGGMESIPSEKGKLRASGEKEKWKNIWLFFQNQVLCFEVMGPSGKPENWANNEKAFWGIPFRSLSLEGGFDKGKTRE